MMTRREMREKIFQLLFQAMFQDPELMPIDPEEKMQVKDLEEAKSKTRAVLDHIPEIDAMINKSARGWKTTRMSKVDLSILRLAVYEIVMDETIPISVAVNEAVELAKLYSSDEAGGFINGILASVIDNSMKPDAQE